MARTPKKETAAESLATDQEIEVELCCDSLLDAIQNGGVQVVEVSPGQYREVIPDEDGKTGIAINYCPFCGQQKLSEIPQ